MCAKWMTFVLTTVLFATGAMFAQQKQSTMAEHKKMNSADRSFITSAAEANLAEIDIAKVVGQRSTGQLIPE